MTKIKKAKESFFVVNKTTVNIFLSCCSIPAIPGAS